MGYHQAGLEVVGVDLVAQPSYPFEFVRMDALAALRAWFEPGRRHPYFDAIHASPPCQAYGAATRKLSTREAPRLVEPVREALVRIGLPYIIENVVGAPLWNPVLLCGSMFGLDVKRHRLFECSTFTGAVLECRHEAWLNRYPTHARKDKAQTSPVVHVYGTGGGDGKDLDLWRTAMEVPWMRTKAEVSEAIPPAYTRHLGAQLLTAASRRRASAGA